MATVESCGAGGKLRKKPLRRQTKPYDRPATALRTSQVVGAQREKNSWLSKLVDPASRLITAGAHKLFSSVFRRRLLPPPPRSSDVMTETGHVQPEVSTMVAPSSSKEEIVYRGNDLSRVSDHGKVAELEDILKQKTFTRSEIDHLTALLLSRTVDSLGEVEKGRSECNFSDEKAVHSRHEITADHPASDNGVERAAISTPFMRSKVVEDVVASPAELAKAYMGSRPMRASSSVLALQNIIPREDQSSACNSFFKPKTPAMSLVQKPASDFGASANGFMTPRFRGRSAIYSMARTPYSRPHSTENLKAAETGLDFHGASSSSSHDVTEIPQLSGSKRQVLKRRSSVLESDIGFVGPIRRIRQKPNLLHHKTLSLPSAHVKHECGRFADVTEVPSSIDWKCDHLSSSKALTDTSTPSTSNGYVPSQSIETAEKIFQQIDKLTSKGKSPEKKVDIAGGSSPGNMTSGMRDGSAHKSMNTLDSMKVISSTQDSRKGNGLLNSINAHDSSPKVSQRVERSAKKFPIPSVEDFAVAVNDNKALDNVNPHSSFGNQQKRTFQMSAHEDFLEFDDDVHTTAVAPTPVIKGVESYEMAKSSVAVTDNHSESAAVSAKKPPDAELNASTNLLDTNKEFLTDGSAASQKITPFTVPVSLPSASATITITQADVSSSPSVSDKAAEQSEKNNEITAFSSNSVASLSFTPSFSTLQSAPAKDTNTELPSSASGAAAKEDEPGKTDDKSTIFSVDVSRKVDALFSKGSGVLSNGSTLHSGLPTANQSLVPKSVSAPLFSFSNGNALSNSTVASSAGTVINTPAEGNLATFGSSSSGYYSTSMTAAPVLFGSSFQTGSSSVASISTTTGTTALDSAAKSGSKSNETAVVNVTSGLFNAKFSGFDSIGNGNSSFNASTFKTANSQTQVVAPALSSGSIFGLQASSSSIAVSTSTKGISSQSASSASSHGFGLSGPVSFNATASTFANPFTSGSTSASSVSPPSTVAAPVSSSSNTSTNIFGWKSPSTAAPFGTSQSTGFAFGSQASGTSAGNNNNPIVFGATSSSSIVSNNAPFVFGSSSSGASVFSTPSALSTPADIPFASQPACCNSIPQPFAFGSTPPVSNNDQVSMEDNMAEDSVQVSAAAAPVFGGAPTLAPSSGFLFGGSAPSTGNSFQFGGQQNQIGSQNTTFQPSGSLELGASGGGSFTVGSGGGDKSNRRIVKVKNRFRKK